MIICAVFVLSLVFKILGCDSKTVSVVVKHRQVFGSQGIDDKKFIQVPEIHEQILMLHNDSKSHMSKGKNQRNIRSIIDVIKYGIKNKQRRNKQQTDVDDVDIEVERYFGSENLMRPAKVDTVKDGIEEESVENNIEDDLLKAQEIQHSHGSVVDINNEQCSIDSLSCLHKLYGWKRTEQDQMNALSRFRKMNRQKRSAREQWRNSLPGSEQTPKNYDDDLEPDIWEEVTDEDLQHAKLNRYRQTMEYIGWTLLSVILFLFVGICFLRDPIACIFAFGTGCPCCLICCPCIRAFTDKYLDTKRIVREQMNKYMPGIIVNDDGSLDFYEPSAEELDVLMEIIDELSD